MATIDQGEPSGGGAFASAGRTGPLRALVVTVVAGLVLKLTGIAFDRGAMLAYVLAGGVAGLTVAWLFAEWTRRLHDAGNSGWWGAAFGTVALVVLLWLTVSDIRYDVPWSMTAAWIAIGVAAAVLLLRPGTPGANRYGPPAPGAFATGRAGAARGGWLWAGIALLGGALIGYAMIDISNGMRDAQQRTRQAIERDTMR